MRIVRFRTKQGSSYGIVEIDQTVFSVEGTIEDGFLKKDEIGVLEEFNLLPPVNPSKIVAIGRNYKAHADEFDWPIPDEPLIFLKPPSSLLPHRGTIEMPNQSKRIEHEAELAVIIGKKTRNIAPQDCDRVVLGYTCANDVTARDLQQTDIVWTRSKGFDTFAPLGPFIETSFNPIDKNIRCRVNGKLRQDGNTSAMLFDVPTLISFISEIMTLEIGDVVMTGTPSGVGPLDKGDQVEVSIEGLGSLMNAVS
jgi:2-keto-4-pentenoate hydratase/2-oxohepta-3-ene-1,7-dioic acid hydratase in catechol pathway